MSLAQLPPNLDDTLVEQRSVVLVTNGQPIWRFLSSTLVDRGYVTIEAESGRHALDLVRTGRHDLAIVTEQLPDMDGIGWITQLREFDESFKVVFVSSVWSSAELYKELVNGLGVSLVVHRPLKPSLLGVQIDNLFRSDENSDCLIREEIDSKDRFDYMRHRYVSVLPARLSALEQMVQKAYAAPNDAYLLTQALRLTHNMKGTASSCGFGVIGTEAEKLEKTLQKIQSVAVRDATELWSHASRTLKSLDEKVLAAIQTHNFVPGDADLNEYENLGKINVLLASHAVYFEWFQNKEINLISARNFAEVIPKVTGINLDAAIIDLANTTPSLAFDLAREVRSLPGCENLPLGFISSDQSDDRAEATRAGGSLFVDRPFDERVLKSAAKYLTSIRQGGRPRVLVVDDDVDFCHLVAMPLTKQGMIVRSIHDPSRIFNVLQEFAPDLILLDLMMPGLSGFEVCRNIKASSRWQDIPIIVLTAQTGVDARINAFDFGADDYLPKPIIDAELLTRVKVRLERAKLLKERGDKDLLTGLLTRGAFTQRMTALVAESSRHNFVFSVCFLDVDHFKNVNDEHGHAAGDEVLAKLGELLTRRFRVEDIRGRWGGEEFVIAFPHATSAVMRGALTRILQEFNSIVFTGEKEEHFQVAFSAGMASYPEDGDSMKTLLQVADKRLYQAKASGRKMVLMHD